MPKDLAKSKELGKDNMKTAKKIVLKVKKPNYNKGKSRRYCLECSRYYLNPDKLKRHELALHPVPKFQPLEIEYVETGNLSDTEEVLNLLGDDLPKLGETFYHVRKFVVVGTKQKKVNGKLEKEVAVTVKCIKRNWQRTL